MAFAIKRALKIKDIVTQGTERHRGMLAGMLYYPEKEAKSLYGKYYTKETRKILMGLARQRRQQKDYLPRESVPLTEKDYIGGK